MNRCLAILIVFFMSTAWSASAQTKEKDSSNIDLSERQLNDVKKMSRKELENAIHKHEELLRKYPHEDITPNILFQLTELFVQKAKLDYDQAMDKYEAQLTAFELGKVKSEPPLPRINYNIAIVLLKRILDEYPTSIFNDKILYRLALCFQEQGDEEAAAEHFDQLITRYAASSLKSEAYFRMGEHFFSKGQDEKAIPYYSHLVSSEMWSNPFFDMAMYKLGWSHYRLNQFAEAISAFMFLLKDIRTIERIQTQQLDRSAADLRKEAIAYIAVSLAESSTPAQTHEFLNAYAENEDKYEVLSKIADVYLQQNRLDEAIKTNEQLLQEVPNHPDAPKFTQSIIEAHEMKWDNVSANNVRGELIARYYFDNAWKNAQTDSMKLEEANQLVRMALYAKGVYHQIQAREQDESPKQYQLAIEQYENFLQAFKDDSLAFRVNFYLAESYFAIDDFVSAANEYQTFCNSYPLNELSENAAYNLVVSYDRLTASREGQDSIWVSIDNFPGADSPTEILVNDAAAGNLIDASNQFINGFPSSNKTIEILFKEAEILQKVGRMDLSRRIYSKIMYDFPDSEHYKVAMTLTAQSYFKEENYVEAEKWYGNLSRSMPDTVAMSQRAKVMMSTSFYKSAEKSKRDGKPLQAAAEFKEVALKYPAAEVAEVALREAGQLYEQAGDTVNAARVYEEFIVRYPGNELYENCVLRAARYREKLKHWSKAGETYLLLRSHDSPNRSIALYSAGICFSKAQDWISAIQTFEDYLPTANGDGRIVEASFRLGLAYYETEQYNSARKALQKTVLAYQSRENGSDELNAFYPARAQFMLAEIDEISFDEIQLLPPFKDNLSKKTRSLSIVLKSYAEAAKYRVGEWTTASSYKIGSVFEDFANAILTSPVPANLSGDEILAYKSQLRNLAVPFQKKALEAHLANIRQAEDNNIENDWTKQSKSRVVVLSDLVSSNREQKQNPD